MTCAADSDKIDSMKIVNKGRLLLSSQLDRLINQLGDKYRPSVLVVCENRWDLFQYFITDSQLITSLADISLWTGKTEGFYLNKGDIVVIFPYAQTDGGDDRHSIQLYTLHALYHELFHRMQEHYGEPMTEEEEEAAADIFATSYINRESSLIAGIMEWEDEWSMWEE